MNLDVERIEKSDFLVKAPEKNLGSPCAFLSSMLHSDRLPIAVEARLPKTIIDSMLAL